MHMPVVHVMADHIAWIIDEGPLVLLMFTKGSFRRHIPWVSLGLLNSTYIKSESVIVDDKSVHLIKPKLLADSHKQLWRPSFLLRKLEGESSERTSSARIHICVGWILHW